MGGKSFKDLYQALFSFRLSGPILFKKNMKLQTDPYGKVVKK